MCMEGPLPAPVPSPSDMSSLVGTTSSPAFLGKHPDGQSPHPLTREQDDDDDDDFFWMVKRRAEALRQGGVSRRCVAAFQRAEGGVYCGGVGATGRGGEAARGEERALGEQTAASAVPLAFHQRKEEEDTTQEEGRGGVRDEACDEERRGEGGRFLGEGDDNRGNLSKKGSSRRTTLGETEGGVSVPLDCQRTGGGPGPAVGEQEAKGSKRGGGVEEDQGRGGEGEDGSSQASSEESTKGTVNHRCRDDDAEINLCQNPSDLWFGLTTSDGKPVVVRSRPSRWYRRQSRHRQQHRHVNKTHAKRLNATEEKKRPVAVSSSPAVAAFPLPSYQVKAHHHHHQGNTQAVAREGHASSSSYYAVTATTTSSSVTAAGVMRASHTSQSTHRTSLPLLSSRKNAHVFTNPSFSSPSSHCQPSPPRGVEAIHNATGRLPQLHPHSFNAPLQQHERGAGGGSQVKPNHGGGGGGGAAASGGGGERHQPQHFHHRHHHHRRRDHKKRGRSSSSSAATVTATTLVGAHAGGGGGSASAGGAGGPSQPAAVSQQQTGAAAGGGGGASNTSSSGTGGNSNARTGVVVGGGGVVAVDSTTRIPITGPDSSIVSHGTTVTLLAVAASSTGAANAWCMSRKRIPCRVWQEETIGLIVSMSPEEMQEEEGEKRRRATLRLPLPPRLFCSLPALL